MPDGTGVAAILLVVGALALAPVATPAFYTIWGADRAHYLQVVGAHRRAWRLLNAGFVAATVITAGGLLALALAADPATGAGALLAAVAVAYAIGGSAWCMELGIRAARDPLLAAMVAEGTPTEPAESLLGAATGGMFATYVITTALALVILGPAVVAAGLAAWPVAAVIVALAAVCLAAQLRTGDCIPAVLYGPTLLLGIALLAGWH